MELQALVTRTINIADESLRVQIEGERDLDQFAEHLGAALALGDARMRVQMERLLEDTGLTEDLDQHDTDAVWDAARLLFPRAEGEDHCLSGVRLEVSKLLSGGEQVTIQAVDLQSYEDVAALFKRLWDLVDSRLAVTNGREMDHMAYVNSLDTPTKLKVSMIMDALYGRTRPSDVRARLLSDNGSGA